MKKLFIILALIIFTFISCKNNHPIVELKTETLLIGISGTGYINKIIDLETETNYLSTDTLAPLLMCRADSVMLLPKSASYNNNIITIQFDSDFEAKIKVEEKPTHINFELISFSNLEKTELIVWGPIPTSIKKTIGETVGVTRNEKYAIGIQALNPKTLGGYPWTDNDCTPQFDIFEQEDYSDLSEANKRETLYRVEAAKPEKFGSTLQCYCRNRIKERNIENLGHKKYTAPVYNDNGIIGSRIALFGCPVDKTLETIGKIETEESLPHPLIDGIWGKQSISASAAYLIFPFNESNIDQAIAFTKQAGLRYLYHPGPFENWGHFDLSQAEFPRGWDGMKNCVEKIEKAGLFAGVHTLSNFITTNDPYVTPVPDTRLGTVGTTVISSDIDSRQNEIPIENPDYFNQYENNNLHTVMIGEELIRYEKVSETAPWKLMKCERGAWKTKSSDHKAGKKISMLTDHGYKVFLSNPELSIEIAKKLAEFYNYTGLRQISFDGLEGNRSTGMGNYGEILFTKTWWDNLSPEIKKHTVIDASRTTHYFWHIYSRMNWGEPWYAGFRESQTEYRLKNQEYFQRNLMPGMLGWFSLRPNTPVEDIEWMLARSAAFNAGYCLVTNERSLQTNGQTNEILKLVGEWEKARMANAFSNEQKEKMKDIANEFHLETKSENSWNLFQIQSFKFKHTEREHQPGEPTFSTFRFDNTDDSNKIHFIITAQDATIAKVKFELDNNNSFELPVPLHNGESVRYSGGDWIEIYSEQFNKVGAFKIDSEQFKVSKGAHSIVIDGVFADRLKEPALKIEIRIFGKPEPIQTKSE